MLSISDNPNLVTYVEKVVGVNRLGIYTFANPVITPSTNTWCGVTSNSIFTTANASMSSPRLTGSGTQPYTTWDFDTTADSFDFRFKIKSYFPNGLYWFSPEIRILAACGSLVSINTNTSPALNQFVNVNVNTDFLLPRFYTS